jgi:hypothetical protein
VQSFSVGMAVRLYPGTEHEKLGHVVEDFGEATGHSVDIAGIHIADPARRWAVVLDDGGLVSSTAITLAQREFRRSNASSDRSTLIVGPRACTGRSIPSVLYTVGNAKSM